MATCLARPHRCHFIQPPASLVQAFKMVAYEETREAHGIGIAPG